LTTPRSTPRRCYWTAKVARPLTPPQLTSIGHVPTVVLGPMFQVQVTAPVAFDVFGTRPCAELGPLLYVTVMVQAVFGAVETVTNPLPLRETGDRTDVKTTSTGFTVGAVGVAVADPELGGVGIGVAMGCSAGAMPASRVAAPPQPAKASRETQIATENRFTNPAPLAGQL
jgi:hypothetical protein